ncbi:FK506-binding protein 15 isoform X2 [Tachysurus ichikawai]
MNDIFPDYHDGEFLAPKSGAKLASLFGLCQAESEGNETFKFTAPKQPKKVLSALGPPLQKRAPPPPAPAVLLAVAVHTFHFVNGQYVTHGKLGAAILGNHVNKEYKILLYGSQQKQITTARIHHGFVFTVQPGNYTAFYDDQRQSWTLKFDSEEARIDFCKEVCVARWNSQTCRDTLMTQDLVHGKGQTVGMGDTVDVALSSWLLQNHAIVQFSDSSSCRDELQRVSLVSDTPLMGWEMGMLGMQKGGRRLIIVPSSMSYVSKGDPDCLPPSSTLVFAVEVHQVNFSKDVDCLASGSTESNKLPVPGLDGNVESSLQCALGSSDQGRQAPIKRPSLNELPKHPDADKAKLISRMAKMGQPTLPFLTTPRESVTEESRDTTLACGSSAQAAASSLLPVETSSAVSSKTAAVQHPEAMNPNTAQDVHVYSDPTFQLQPFTLSFPPQHTAYLPDLGSFMMTETRQHNTEIRLAVARVTDKIDYLASKVDELHKHGICSLALSSGSLETAMILHNIQRVIQENSSLETGSRVEEQHCKTGELADQRCMERSSLLLEQTNNVLQSSSHHARLLHAEQEKMRLAEELDVFSSRVCKMQQEADGLQQKVTELQAELTAVLQKSQSRCDLITTLESKVEELEKEVAQSQQQWREEKQKRRKMEWTMTNMEEEIQDLSAENQRLNQLLSDRKRKWQQERERFLLELEEQRSSSDQEQQQLLEQLRRARVQAGTHSRAQLECQERCDAALKQRNSKLEEVNTLLQKLNAKLQKDLERERQQLEAQLAVQVKWVMNELFHSLRAQFDLQESQPGETVLKIVLSTIKCVTMQFLKKHKPEEEEEEEEEEEYISAEEQESEKMKEHGIKHEEFESPQSLDHTYTTAYEVNGDASLASDIEKQAPLNSE